MHAQTLLFGTFGSIFFFSNKKLILLIFFYFYFNHKDYVLGAIWIGTILKLKDLPVNSTFNYASSCGVNNCPGTKLPESASKPSVSSVYGLCATINGACILSILIAFFFVDDLKYDENMNKIERGKIGIQKISKKKIFFLNSLIK